MRRKSTTSDLKKFGAVNAQLGGTPVCYGVSLKDVMSSSGPPLLHGAHRCYTVRRRQICTTDKREHFARKMIKREEKYTGGGGTLVRWRGVESAVQIQY